VRLAIPEGAEIDNEGSSWHCKLGFRQAGARCVAVRVPDNGQIAPNGWECIRGYMAVDDRCAVVTVPTNGQLDSTGHD
jgi:hypothetical protein